MGLLEKAIGVVAPHDCLGCGHEGDLLCNWCAPEACPPLPSRCYRCHALSDNSRVCRRCRPRTRLGHVWVRTEYEGIAKQLISQLKFERNRAAAECIANLLNDGLPYLDEETIIVHVPTITSHTRQRGYDQAKLIAASLSNSVDRLHITLLARLGQQQQVGSKRAARLTQLETSFRPVKVAFIQGARILLVDDVLTTGATLEAAARTLKTAGARSVDAVVFAQTQ